MTQTSYQIEGHAYTETTPCGSPETCTNRKHWQIDGETKTLDAARADAKLNDAPAVRIVKIVRTETREVVAG